MPRIVPIEEWGGTRNGWGPMSLPAEALWVHHSVTTATNDPYQDFRTLNRIGAGNGHGGISYSYVIHPDGTIGEGQGISRGAHTGGTGCGNSRWGWNPCSFGVCFVGNYMHEPLTEAAIRSFHHLRDHLIAEGVLQPGEYPTGGHQQAPGNATACPGTNIMVALPELKKSSTPTTPSTQEASVIFVGQSQANPGIIYALHPVNGIIAAEFSCKVGEEVYGIPPSAGPYISGEGTGNGLALPLRFVLPHVIDWLRAVQGYTLTPPNSGGGGGSGASKSDVQAIVSASEAKVIAEVRKPRTLS